MGQKSSNSSVKLKQFSLFSSLPHELRHGIWRTSLPDPRWIDQLKVASAPVAMSVNCESRAIARQNFSSIPDQSVAYINWKADIIGAELLRKCDTFLSPGDISQIQNLAIRRFDPDDENPTTIWQRNPTYRGWPLYAFQFNCNAAIWGSNDIPAPCLSNDSLKSLTTCYLIALARNQMIFLGGKIMGYADVISTMQEDLLSSKRLSTDSTLCTCNSPTHPNIKLVQEIPGHEGMRLVDLQWRSVASSLGAVAEVAGITYLGLLWRMAYSNGHIAFGRCPVDLRPSAFPEAECRQSSVLCWFNNGVRC